MRTVLHIGTTKTGTTHLQDTFLTSRDALIRHGVLYPRPIGRFNNHRILLAGHVPYDKLPRHMKNRGGETELVEMKAAFLAELRRDLRTSTARSVVLSSESFMGRAQKSVVAAVRDDLTDLGLRDVLVACYLRRPDSHYLSMLQQTLRASHRINPLRGMPLREKLSVFAEVYGRDAVSPRIYDRTALIDGDVIADFAASYLPDAGLSPDEFTRSSEANETLSSDSMAIARQYRLDMHRDANDRYTQDSSALIRTLAEIDRRLKLGRPKLREEVAQRLIAISARDLAWLRGEYGLEFPGVDYASLAEASEEEAPLGLDAIVVLDADRQAQILDALIETKWSSQSSMRRKWIEGLRGTVSG